jgi:hypothetical protein
MKPPLEYYGKSSAGLPAHVLQRYDVKSHQKSLI